MIHRGVKWTCEMPMVFWWEPRVIEPGLHSPPTYFTMSNSRPSGEALPCSSDSIAGILFCVDEIDERAFLLEGHYAPQIADADFVDELDLQLRSRIGPAQ